MAALGGTARVFSLGQRSVSYVLRLTVRDAQGRGVGHRAFRSEEAAQDCRLRLAFSAQAVVVATEPGHGECGFGQGVSADETYRRTSAAGPPYFTDSSGKPFFKKTTPSSIMRPVSKAPLRNNNLLHDRLLA